MAVESLTQMSLANSTTFRSRLMYLMVQEARTVKAEALATVGHAERSAYAGAVIDNPGALAQSAAVMLVGGINLIATVVTDLDPNKVDSSASDAAILSQIATFWSALANVDTGA